MDPFHGPIRRLRPSGWDLRQMGYWGSLVGRLAGLAAALQVDD